VPAHCKDGRSRYRPTATRPSSAGPDDNLENDQATGAAWVFTRSDGAWIQQGQKLVGTGASANSAQGWSVALSGDGNTALIAGPNPVWVILVVFFARTQRLLITAHRPWPIAEVAAFA